MLFWLIHVWERFCQENVSLTCAGVCNTDGVVHDFAGGVNVGHFAFGHPTKFLQLEPVAASALAPMPQLLSNWDRAIHYSEGIFNQSLYSFCGNNCHRFVAHFLEQIRFGNRHEWGQVQLVWPDCPEMHAYVYIQSPTCYILPLLR